MEDVRCLGCRHVYAKPAQGSTASRNPGCPKCGYVGWLSLLIAVPAQQLQPPAPYGPTTVA